MNDFISNNQTSFTSSNSEVSHITAELLEKVNSLKIESSPSNISIDISKNIKNPTIDEVLFDACASVKILTSAVSMYLSNEFRQSLFEQIDLIHDAEDWDSDESPVNQNSFKSFLRWYLLESPIQNPGLGLGSSGNVIAAWFNNQDRLIIEFLPNDKAKWMVSKYIDNETERGSGTTNIFRLSEVLSPYTVDVFFSQED